MIEMDEKSRTLLTDAIRQSGPYTSGSQVKVSFVGKFYGPDAVHDRRRTIEETLEPDATVELVRDASFAPIIDAYGLEPELVLEVEIEKITLTQVLHKS